MSNQPATKKSIFPKKISGRIFLVLIITAAMASTVSLIIFIGLLTVSGDPKYLNQILLSVSVMIITGIIYERLFRPRYYK